MTAQVAIRVTEVYALLVAGVSTDQIKRLAKDKYFWNVSSRSIDYYISKAKERLDEESKVRRSSELGKAIARLDSQYFRADQRKDHRGAVIAVLACIKLLRLDMPEDDDRDELRRFLDLMEGVKE